MRWYIQPRYALWRAARARMFQPEEPSPWEPIVEMFRLGLAPIGYAKLDGEEVFVIYAPEPAEEARAP